MNSYGSRVNKKLLALSSLIALLVLPSVAFALTATEWINGIISRFLSIVVWPIFFVAVVTMLLWSGLLFVTAQGDPGKITTAKHALIWAIVGIVVGVLSFSAVSIVQNIIQPPAGGAGQIQCGAAAAPQCNGICDGAGQVCKPQGGACVCQ